MALATSENYQLKWHSYGAHLHSSVATLLHSESFADVLLATSCGRHVAAHRFVLAACSSYLSHIFQTCHFGANTNAPIIVVLPTEIGYRTLKILIQYMYSGEATVTNDQLEGVLKAGDILRVRGLWRSNSSSSSSSSSTTSASKKENIQSNNQKVDRDKQPIPGGIQKIKLVQPTSDKTVDTTIPSIPPLVPSSSLSSSSSSSAAAASTSSTTSTSTTTILPAATAGTTTTTTTTTATTTASAAINAVKLVIQPTVQPLKILQKDKDKDKINNDKNSNSSEKKTTVITNTEMAKKTIVENNKITDENKNKENLESNSKKRRNTSTSEAESNKSCKSDADDNNSELNLELLVKDEPIDWEDSMDPAESLTIDHDIDIKPEIIHSAEEDDADMDEEEYTPLTCDLCSQTFNRPSDWVRHIEFTHADMTENKRKKRKDDDDSKDFPPLKCDLCGNQFPTPQEWVRHIQTEHTEEQLALMNNSAPPKPKRVHNHQKLCNICQKVFPSHASMVIHQRTHTGEKPFLCSYCKKGFNVKSNLLRHLRTLHDKFVHPSLYGSNGKQNA
ncbi:uncharacterized protein DDB_G0284459-like isoform X2 [Aphidius gifuensis]|nr:uncharacterized protein DDB_G0284459-like isoform X2 [Aphidius gifuensis]